MAEHSESPEGRVLREKFVEAMADYTEGKADTYAVSAARRRHFKQREKDAAIESAVREILLPPIKLVVEAAQEHFDALPASDDNLPLELALSTCKTWLGAGDEPTEVVEDEEPDDEEDELADGA